MTHRRREKVRSLHRRRRSRNRQSRRRRIGRCRVGHRRIRCCRNRWDSRRGCRTSLLYFQDLLHRLGNIPGRCGNRRSVKKQSRVFGGGLIHIPQRLILAIALLGWVLRVFRCFAMLHHGDLLQCLSAVMCLLCCLHCVFSVRGLSPGYYWRS